MRALNQPTSWWGWNWEQPTPMSIVEIVEAGNMDNRVAAMFWLAMERGASIIIAADPPHSGKTTTLSALLTFTKPETAVYFTRGVGETFALPVVSSTYDTYILVNEMSDHIPVYTWDEYARRAFELLAQGYRLATTMHDETVEGVIRQLEGDLGVPSRHVGNMTFIVPMFIGRRERIIRRVTEVAFLQPNNDGYAISTAATWDRGDDSFHLFEDPDAREAFARWARLSVEELGAEIDKRAGFLQALSKTDTREIPQVNAAILGYYEEFVRGT